MPHRKDRKDRKDFLYFWSSHFGVVFSVMQNRSYFENQEVRNGITVLTVLTKGILFNNFLEHKNELNIHKKGPYERNLFNNFLEHKNELNIHKKRSIRLGREIVIFYSKFFK